jgi:hypothetical protein
LSTSRHASASLHSSQICLRCGAIPEHQHRSLSVTEERLSG